MRRLASRLIAPGLLSCLLAATPACDGSAGSTPLETADGQVSDTDQADTGDQDATPDAAQPQDDGKAEPQDDSAETPDEGPIPLAYPEGPYGTKQGDTIANLSFWDPWEGRMVELAEFYNRPEVKMLVIVSGAGWCGPCQMEAEDLVGYHDLYAKDGFEVIYTLFEGQPPGKTLYTGDAESTAYSDGFMQAWKDTFEVDYPLYGDPGHTLAPYFSQNATPLTLIVRTKAKKECPDGFDHPACHDMVIDFVDVGYGQGPIKDSILSILYN